MRNPFTKRRFGCKYGESHDLHPIHETPRVKWEICTRCCRKFRWNKGAKGRVQNVAYLEAHSRNYAQKGGATNRLYMRLYEPEKCIINITNA